MDPTVFVTSTRQWHVPHFESLGDFGVWQGVIRGTVYQATTAPILQGPHHLGVIQQLTGTSNLITEIQKAVTTDSYLSGVLQSVMDSDDNFFRDFFLDAREKLCYQRMEDTRPQVCVPTVCREAVLRVAHGDSTLAGHPGIDRTTAAVSHAFYWPGLHANVAHFVRTCEKCSASKSSNHQRLGRDTYSAIPIQPFTSWAMDLIGPMPRSKDGNEWIVTWVDRTSKTIVAAAAAHKNISAEDLAKLTFKEICCRFGPPQNLTTDNDVRFVSSLWKSLWLICGTKLRFTSSYHTQADPAERANRQVLEALRATLTTVVQYDEWDRALPHITFSLNNHVSVATIQSTRGARCPDYLPPSFGKTHNQIYMSQLKFFEARDAKPGEGDTAPEPLLGHDGVMHYEIKCICDVLTLKEGAETLGGMAGVRPVAKRLGVSGISHAGCTGLSVGL